MYHVGNLTDDFNRELKVLALLTGASDDEHGLIRVALLHNGGELAAVLEVIEEEAIRAAEFVTALISPTRFVGRRKDEEAVLRGRVQVGDQPVVGVVFTLVNIELLKVRDGTVG